MVDSTPDDDDGPVGGSRGTLPYEETGESPTVWMGGGRGTGVWVRSVDNVGGWGRDLDNASGWERDPDYGGG